MLYMKPMIRKASIFRLCVATVFALASGAAFAKDAPKAAASGSLPGVKGGHIIVKPLPEPDDEANPASGQFRIGDTEVRIGGSVTVDIGVGSVGPTRH